MEILLTGNTGYITEHFIEIAFPEDHVIIGGPSRLETKKNILKLWNSEEGKKYNILEEYEPDRIIYFSYYLTLHGDMTGELENLQRIMKYCRKRNTQFLYLTSLHGDCLGLFGKKALVKSAEQLCMSYPRAENVDMKIVRLPYLYSGAYEGDFFYRLFEHVEEDGIYDFAETKNSPAYFLNMSDLADLLYRILDNWKKEKEILTVPDVFGITFGQLCQRLEEQVSHGTISCNNGYLKEELGEVDSTIRKRYGWFPRICILDDVEEIHEDYIETRPEKRTILQRMKDWSNNQNRIWKICEILIAFGLMEYFNGVLGNHVQFRMIDVRVVFIVIIGTIYGLPSGVFAAFLASLSLGSAYVHRGMKWYMLFYDPVNWLPFLFYFMVGAICGYVQLYNKNHIYFVKRENTLIREKFYFMRDLYRDAFGEKKDLKKQIISSKDSFGKIFEITKQLDAEHPQEIFMRAIKVMENILENHSIAIYSFGKNPYFARLEAASREMKHGVLSSISVENFSQEIHEVYKSGIWVNRKFQENRPAYIAGVQKEGKLALLIILKEASYSQMTLYYENLLKIMCGLLETSLVRALQYQKAMYDEKHINHSMFMKEQYFLKKLHLCQSMSDENILEYTLLELLVTEELQSQLEHILTKFVRENDTAGVVEGRVYLILHQSTEKNAEIVQARLRSSGIESRVVHEHEKNQLLERE